MQSAGQGFMQWPASPTGVSTALCLEGFLHFRSCYSASELAAWTAVCVLERLREAFIENPSEPVHSELGEAIAHYDRVNRKLMEHRPEMASMSVENWLADSLLRNVQKAVQRITVVQSGDPNEKTGCAGFGPSHAVSNGQMLHYRIDFENVPTATAPAATVEVTDLLDTALLDPATVQLLHVGFGSYDANPLQVAGQFNATIDLRPAQDLLVSVEGACDVATGRLHWKFTTLDPATGREPTNALLGFLPPNQMAPQGQGYVTFSVMPRASVGTSTTIRNKAAIVFDFNPAIETAEWSNIVDAEVPRSAAAASTPQPGLAEIPVSWSGTDDSSGVLDYRVYVSEDGDPYTLWQDGVAETSAIFQGAPGHSYRFYSVARDQTGNVESKSTFDAEVVLPSAPAEEGGGGSVGWEAVVLVIAAVGRGLSLARRRGPRGRAV